MKRKLLLFTLFPMLFWAQKEPDYLQCYLKSLITVCGENSKKVISEISSNGGIKIYGRFNDLQKGLSERTFEKYKEKIRFNCSENVKYDSLHQIHYSQETGDDRKFYFLYSGFPSKIMYKGSERIEKVKVTDLKSSQKYLQLYNKEKQEDRRYEAFYYYYDSQDRLIYSFHQHGNEFDEYTYIYTDSFYGTELSQVYKNEILFEEYSYSKEEDTFEKRIREYNVDESYRLDKKDRPVLKKSTYLSDPNHCTCKKGYTTTIIYWDHSKCSSNITLE